MDYFYFNGVSYVLICDYFSKFPYMFKAKTSFWALRNHLMNLFSIESYPDQIVSENGSPFNSREFNKFFSQDRHNTYHFFTLLPKEQWLHRENGTDG